MRPRRDIKIGDRYGRLVIQRIVNYGKHPKVDTKCDCGATSTHDLSGIFGGRTRSCGCLSQESRRATKFRHGHSRKYGSGQQASAEYTAWINMRVRCRPESPDYCNYGARGITVCDRWINSFENFLNDMGPKPSPKHSIERKNNNLGYGPENCVWATNREQSLNKRNTPRFSDGAIVSVWLERVGAPRHYAYSLMKNEGLSWDDVRYYYSARLGMLA